jgi:hypothetical protein
MKCFEAGLAPPAFEFLRHMLLLSEVLALMRLWDDTDGVHSIPALANRLSGAALIAKLVERERHLQEDIRQADALLGEGQGRAPFPAERQTADQREDDLRGSITSWLADYKALKGRTECARLKKHRHELLAHSAAVSRVPQVQPMRYDDAQKLLEKTIPLVSTGFRIATGITYDFATTVSVWHERQFEMWEILRSAGRGQPFSPTPRTENDLVREFVEKGISSIVF